jgi:hypothetical protein
VQPAGFLYAVHAVWCAAEGQTLLSRCFID